MLGMYPIFINKLRRYLGFTLNLIKINYIYNQNFTL